MCTSTGSYVSSFIEFKYLKMRLYAKIVIGGVLERTKIDPNDNTESNIYWINVDESLEKIKRIW